MKNMENEKIPQVTFKARENYEWKEISTDDLFKGKNVIVFSLPGAFTPTCSSTHVPGYNHLKSQFEKAGIDDIVCISVNDGFVMESWKRDQEADNITFIPDGNGEFTEKMGLLVDKSDIGFGKRSWRYSMLVRDGVVEKMFIEPEKPGDPFEVSDAETMLKYLNPNAEKNSEVSIFTKDGCPHCARAKKLLKEKGISYEEIVLGKNISYTSLRAISGESTAPQVFINGNHIGGADALEEYFKKETIHA